MGLQKLTNLQADENNSEIIDPSYYMIISNYFCYIHQKTTEESAG